MPGRETNALVSLTSIPIGIDLAKFSSEPWLTYETTNNVGDLHEMVVDNICKMVCGLAIRLQ